MKLCWALVLLLAATFQSPLFTIAGTSDLPAITPGVDYRYAFTTTGGTAPITWTISQGKLPPGLALQSTTGVLAGTPRGAGPGRASFEVTATGADSRTAVRTFTLATATTLALRWLDPPSLNGAVLSATAEVENLTHDPLDLTFIAVAVSEIGKANALGYQHFTLSPGKQKIPFSSSLPPGNYLVHVDAVAEYAPRQAIYRSLLETTRKFLVPPGIP